MKRQPQPTKRSLVRSSSRVLVSAALIESALLLASCSDESSSNVTPSFGTTSDTSSSNAPTTTFTPANPTTPPTHVNPVPNTSTNPATSATSITTTTADDSDAQTSGVQTADTSGPDTTTELPGSTAPDVTTDMATIDIPTLPAEDAGAEADASVSQDTAADTTQPESTTEAPATEADASVSEDVPDDTTESPQTDSAPGVTSDQPGTSAPESSSAIATSDDLYGPNLITNFDFEAGTTTGWTPFSAGGVTISAVDTLANSGDYSAYATGRTASWHGIATDLASSATPGTTYHAQAAVRVAGSASVVADGEPVGLTFVFSCNGAQETFHTAANGTATDTGWTILSGEVTLPDCATTVTQLEFYVEGPATGVDIYADDVSVREVL